MTPYELEIILHHWTGTPDEFPRASAPAYPETVAKLVDRGLLHNGDGHRLTGTALCDAFIGMLCETPLPRLCYVDPRFPASEQS